MLIHIQHDEVQAAASSVCRERAITASRTLPAASPRQKCYALRRLRQPDASEHPLQCDKHRMTGRVHRRQGQARGGCCCCAPGVPIAPSAQQVVGAAAGQQADISLGAEQFAEARCLRHVRAPRLRPAPLSCVCALRASMRWASSAADLACFRKGAHVISQCQRGGGESEGRERGDSTAGGAADRTALTKLLEWKW